MVEIIFKVVIMNARQTTFDILREYEKGYRFTGYGLAQEVKRRTGETHYVASMLRYMRIFRQETGRRIVNVDKARSIYEIW